MDLLLEEIFVRLPSQNQKEKKAFGVVDGFDREKMEQLFQKRARRRRIFFLEFIEKQLTRRRFENSCRYVQTTENDLTAGARKCQNVQFIF